MTTTASVYTQGSMTTVVLPTITIHFSYDTCIGFTTPAGESLVRENAWGTTTGKHLNSIDGGSAAAKRARVSGADFETALASRLAPATSN